MAFLASMHCVCNNLSKNSPGLVRNIASLARLAALGPPWRAKPQVIRHRRSFNESSLTPVSTTCVYTIVLHVRSSIHVDISNSQNIRRTILPLQIRKNVVFLFISNTLETFNNPIQVSLYLNAPIIRMIQNLFNYMRVFWLLYWSCHLYDPNTACLWEKCSIMYLFIVIVWI